VVAVAAAVGEAVEAQPVGVVGPGAYPAEAWVAAVVGEASCLAGAWVVEAVG
jgi:hypothetical protein